MPDLPDLLARAAVDAEPSAVPPVEHLLRRRRARVQRRAVAGAVSGTLAVVAAAALVLPGLPSRTDPGLATALPPAPSLDGRETQVPMAARTAPGGRGLVLSYLGGVCESDTRVDVAEAQEAVRVTVSVVRSDGFCPDVGISRTVTAVLDRPLGGRDVVVTGVGDDRVLDVFDGARLLEPSVLPDGYALRGEAGRTDESGEPAWSRRYGEPERPPTAAGACGPGRAGLSLDQLGPGVQPFSPDQWSQERTVDVGGADAALLVGTYPPDGSALGRALVWQAAGGTVVLQSALGCRGDVVATADELLEIARGLR